MTQSTWRSTKRISATCSCILRRDLALTWSSCKKTPRAKPSSRKWMVSTNLMKVWSPVSLTLFTLEKVRATSCSNCRRGRISIWWQRAKTTNSLTRKSSRAKSADPLITLSASKKSHATLATVSGWQAQNHRLSTPCTTNYALLVKTSQLGSSWARLWSLESLARSAVARTVPLRRESEPLNSSWLSWNRSQSWQRLSNNCKVRWLFNSARKWSKKIPLLTLISLAKRNCRSLPQRKASLPNSWTCHRLSLPRHKQLKKGSTKAAK